MQSPLLTGLRGRNHSTILTPW